MPAKQLERITKVSGNFASDFRISAPVGDWARGAKNAPSDVEAVQLLLQYVAQKRGRKDLDPLGVDGKISRLPGKSNTVKAICAFQRDFMRQPDGVVDPEGTTLGKLRSERGSSSAATKAAKSVMMAPRAGDGMPPWLQGVNGDKVASAPALLSPPKAVNPAWISVAEQELGQKEMGEEFSRLPEDNNPRIVQYHATTGKFKEEDTPWCASFVNWVLKRAGYDGTNSASTHTYKSWGDGLSKPAVGSIAFIDWGRVYPKNPKKQGTGHVGFVVGKDASGKIVLLGGNQSNSVRYQGYAATLIHAYRVPKGYQPTAEQYDLPIMKIAGGGGGFSSTR